MTDPDQNLVVWKINLMSCQRWTGWKHVWSDEMNDPIILPSLALKHNQTFNYSFSIYLTQKFMKIKEKEYQRLPVLWTRPSQTQSWPICTTLIPLLGRRIWEGRRITLFLLSYCKSKIHLSCLLIFAIIAIEIGRLLDGWFRCEMVLGLCFLAVGPQIFTFVSDRS